MVEWMMADEIYVGRLSGILRLCELVDRKRFGDGSARNTSVCSFQTSYLSQRRENRETYLKIEPKQRKSV